MLEKVKTTQEIRNAHQIKGGASGHQRSESTGAHNTSNQWVIDEAIEEGNTNLNSEENRERVLSGGNQSVAFKVPGFGIPQQEHSSDASSVMDPFSKNQKRRATRFKYDPETDKIQ